MTLKTKGAQLVHQVVQDAIARGAAVIVEQRPVSKAQQFVDFLNKRIADTGYNQRQVLPNRVYFSLMQGPKYARIVHSSACNGSRSSYAFIDKAGNIYKAAGWKGPAKGVRAKVDDVLKGDHPWFTPTYFDQRAYSTTWLYAS
jgi:hypothetical protein